MISCPSAARLCPSLVQREVNHVVTRTFYLNLTHASICLGWSTSQKMAQNTPSKEAKETFFSDLVRLDSLTDDSEHAEDERLSRLISASERTHSAVTSLSVAEGLPRTVSAPQPLSQDAAVPNTDMPTDMPQELSQVAKENRAKPTMKKSKTTAVLPETKAEGPAHKRRRTYSARMIPEPMQIFKGLVFCQCTSLLLCRLSLLTAVQSSFRITIFQPPVACGFREPRSMGPRGIDHGVRT